jgi:transcriptional regulator with XRE-family HTH domain
MANDRVRDALLRNGLSPDDAADRLGVDRKTIERWITTGRTPYRKHRHELAALLHESEGYLWPAALDSSRRAEVARSEVIEIYPHRADSPIELWSRLFSDVNGELDVLVYAGLFLPEQEPKFVRRLAKKADSGLKIRMLLGDPESPVVAQRGTEERIGDSLAYRIRNALHHFEALDDTEGIEIRLHATTLYNSLFRFDDELLVTSHVYGLPGAHAPLLHLRRLAEGDLFSTYAESFERVWSVARPAWT